MIILGIDPGSHVTGYGVVATGELLQVVKTGVIRTDPRMQLPARLKVIHQGVLAMIDECRPDEMAVETVFNARNARSSLILGHARGVAVLAGSLRDLSVAEYAPREIKKALTGNGAATKEQVRFMVARCLGWRGAALSLDQSDALAVAICHATRSSFSLPRQAGAKGG